MTMAARAYASLKGNKRATINHVKKVAKLALQHRRPEVAEIERELWNPEDNMRVEEIIQNA